MKITDNDIRQCIHESAREYFASCRENVPLFVDKHFRYPGALRTNRVAFGWDLLRAPLNLFWAPCYALICLVRYLLHRSGKFPRLNRLLEKTPAGMNTQVQKRISMLILNELLRHDTPHSLPQSVTGALRELYRRKNKSEVSFTEFQHTIEPLVQEALVQYQVTRTASADISNTLSCAVLGAFAFKKFTPGGIGVGVVLATVLAEKMAANNFIFGETLGKIYYGFFPPQPSLSVLSFSLIGVMAGLSVIAAFSGIVTDPIQARFGIHQKRLRKMLNALEKDFMESTRSSFRPKDQFIARILDAFDMLKSSLI